MRGSALYFQISRRSSGGSEGNRVKVELSSGGAGVGGMVFSTASVTEERNEVHKWRIYCKCFGATEVWYPLCHVKPKGGE